MLHYARDPASADGIGYRIPGLAHALSLLAEDKGFREEFLSKVLDAHKQLEVSARRCERSVVTPTRPEPGSAFRDKRI